MPSPSQIYVPGPCHIWIAPMVATGSQTYSYLGVTESGIDVSENLAEDEVMVDISGPRIPWDVALLGKELFLSGILIKFVESVWESFASRTNFANSYLAMLAGDVGTLIRQEHAGFSVAISCPYASKAAYSTMPIGFTFPVCYLANSWDMTLSTLKKRQKMTIRAIPNWALDGSAILGTTTLPGSLPAIS